jgi:hypothetical protein
VLNFFDACLDAAQQNLIPNLEQELAKGIFETAGGKGRRR